MTLRCYLAFMALITVAIPVVLRAEPPGGPPVAAANADLALAPILDAYEAAKFAEACRIYRAIAPGQGGLNAARIDNLGAIVLLGCGEVVDAKAAIDRAAADLGAGAEPRFRQVVSSNRALIIGRSGRWDEAAAILESVLAERTAGAGDGDPATAAALANLAAIRWRQNRLAEAEAMFADAAGRAGLKPDASRALLAVARLNLGASQTLGMQPAEALQSTRDARAALTDAVPNGHPLALRAELALAEAEADGVRWQDAPAAAKRRDAIWQAARDAHDPADPTGVAIAFVDYVPLVRSETGFFEAGELVGDADVLAWQDMMRGKPNTDSVPYARGLVALAERRKDLSRLSNDLNTLSLALERSGDLPGAAAVAESALSREAALFDMKLVMRDDFLRTLRLLEQTGAKDRADAWRARERKALPILEQASQIERKFYQNRAGPAENLALVERELALLAGYPGPASPRYANALDYKAIFLGEAGRPDEAIEVLEQSLTVTRIAQEGHPSELQRKLLFYTDLLALAGRRQEALRGSAEALRLAAASGDSIDRARVSYIDALIANGRVDEALGWARRRLALIDRANQLGESKLARNKEIAAQGGVGDVVQFGFTGIDESTDYAKVLIAAGRWAEAAQTARQVIVLGDAYGPNETGFDRAERRMLLGRALMGLRDFAGAERAFADARAGLAKSKVLETDASDRAATLLASARLSLPGQAPSALALLAPLMARAQAQPSGSQEPLSVAAAANQRDAGRAGLFALYADALWAQGEGNDLATRRETALAALQRAQATPASRAVALSAARRAAEQGSGALGALARAREALVQRWVDAERKAAALTGSSESDAEAQRQQIASERDTIRTRFAEVNRALGEQAPGFFALVAQEPVSTQRIQALLGPDEAALLVAPTDFGSHLVAVTKESIVWSRSAWTRSEIDGAVRRLLWFSGGDIAASTADQDAWLAEVDGGANGFDRATAHALYTQIVAPVASALEGKTQLFVSAGGSLASLPFAMLVASPPEGRDDDPAALRATQWFGDRFALTQLPSLQSLELLRGAPLAKTAASASTSGFIGFGDPVLAGTGELCSDRGRNRGNGSRGMASGSRGGGLAALDELNQMCRLQGTAGEIAAMAKTLSAPPSAVFLGPRNTEGNFKGAPLGQAKIVSLATHGLLGGSLTGLDEPGLVFTPPATATASDDGYLTSSEIAGLALRADWVVLSACNTAAGDGSEGAPGLSGLARAFFYAGARSLLVSNWPVRDDVAPALTVGTIEREIAEPALSRSQALQRAIRAARDNPVADGKLIKGIDQTWAHPAAWAPFSLVGDGAR